MNQQQAKPNYIQRANINAKKGIPRASSSGDQGDWNTESHRSPAIEVHTTNSVVKTDQFEKLRKTKRFSQIKKSQRTLKPKERRNPQKEC